MLGNHEFQEGDVVRLVDGVRPMTIGAESLQYGIICHWFDKNRMYICAFPPEKLVRIEGPCQVDDLLEALN